MEISNLILRKEEQIALQLRSLYEQRNYQLFRLNSFEEYHFYLEKKNFLSGDDVIKFNGNDGRLMALNPDVTLSIVKNTPNKEQRRVYYNENIYRRNRRNNEYRRLDQIGVELIGSVDRQTEVEMVQLALESLSIMGKGKLEISHSGIIAAIQSLFPESQQVAVFKAVKNKNSTELAEIAASVQLDSRVTTAILSLMQLSGPLDEVFPSAFAAATEIEGLVPIFQSLQELVAELARQTDFDSKMLNFDLSTVNDTNYYSGIIFQGFIQTVPEALLFGGRYDGLFQSLGKEQQAIGFGIYLDLLEKVQADDQKAPTIINVALPKGRMGKAIYQLFVDAGLCQAGLLDESRKLIFYDEDSQMHFFLVKPSDVAAYVEHGAADIGIVGRDILLETEADIIDLAKFPLGRCRIAVAGPVGFQENTSRPLKVATKYPNITRKYFGERSRPVELIYLNGSIELAPLVGLADVIVDIVETGTTLKENDLAILQEITDSAAHLVVNRASWRFKKEQINDVLQKVSERL